MKKVIFITNIPNPYRIPLYNELNESLRKQGYTLKVVFGSSGYKRRMFSLDTGEFHFEHITLDDKGHSFSDDGEKTYFLYKGLSTVLTTENPDVILVAGFSAATMKVFRYCLFNHTPYIIISGTIERGNRNNNLIRKTQRRVLASKASAFVAYGNLAKKYLVNKSVPEKKIFIGRNTVDTSFFANETARIRSTSPRKGAPFYFTCLGYLVPRKNIKKVLEAAKLLAKETDQFKVDIIGDGISKTELQQYAEENNLQDFVTFHGFKQKNEIPFYFARSSGLLFQTDYDIWGLVLNEAMAAGLPCLASPEAGATYDLIKEGETGFVTDYNDPSGVVDKMKWIIQHPAEAEALGKRAAEFITTQVSIKDAVHGYLEAISYAMNQSAKN